MPGLADPFHAYVPPLLHGWMAETPESVHREVDGSLVFVDISGFTRLSEQLARRGKVGAEELTDAIATCFAALLAVAYPNGGSVIKFGGDALLLLFTGVDHPARAACAAFGMRRALAEVGRLETSAGRITVGMSVGVHSGLVHLFLVGGSHRELIVAGACVTETVQIEAAAKAGEILVSPSTAGRLAPELVGPQRAPGLLLIGEPCPEAGLADPASASGSRADVLACIPVALREYLALPDREPEHRRVTVAFLRFRGVDELVEAGSATAATALDGVVRCVQRAADHHGISFLGTDIDRDGGKIILAAGAPASAGNDEERMLLVLRDIVAVELDLPIHIGVNSGPVFAGDVGSPDRRVYTVMGDVVNVSARLMGAAARCEVLATEAVLNHSRTRFVTTALGPIRVKGKEETVPTYRVEGVEMAKAPPSTAALPLLGREDELAAFDKMLHLAREGAGALVELVGEAGIGKSRLVEAFRERADGFLTDTVVCELYRSTTPYTPFRRLLRTLLNIPEGATQDAAAARLLEVVGQTAPEALPWAPLLAIPVGVELPPTPETVSVDDQFRRAHIHQVTVDLLGQLLTGPALITIEDVQWLDEASADLLRHLVRRLGDYPWLICLTRRGEDPSFDEGGSSLMLHLRPLGEIATVALAQFAADEAPLPEHEVMELVQRSGGNPLFLQELLAAARAGGLDGLPDSIEGLVTARIDQLPHEARTFLRHVSVLGQRFDLWLVDAVVADNAAQDEQIWRQLVDFLTRTTDVRFHHALTRDAAYEGLPYRLRRRLHATVGDTIAAAGNGQADLLSFHYFLAGRHAEAWRYSVTAAEDAAAIYANQEAARFYGRALQASNHLDHLPVGEVERVTEALGDVLERMGDYEKAAEAYRRARRSAGGDPVSAARLLLKQARLQAWLRRYSQALGLITRGLRGLKDLKTNAARAQRAQLMVWYGHFRQEQGRHDEAMSWSRRAIEEAEAAGDRDALAHAYRLLDWVYADRGEFEKATNSRHALALYEQLGDLPSQASVLNNMGGLAYWQGDWASALDFYERAYELDERTGDVVGAALDQDNIGEILIDQGRIEDAEKLLRAADRVMRAAGHRSGVAFVTKNLGRAAARAGRFDAAHDLLERALAGWEAIGAEVQAVEATARIAELHVMQGHADEALALADDALEHATVREGVAAQSPLIHRIRAYALMQRHQLPEARASLEESLRAAQAREAEYEIALTQRALGELARLQGDEPPRALVDASQAVFNRLGVEQLPSVPLPVSGAAAAQS